ncbi:hypothetical protein PFI31113_04423 [Pandoraea fibrosis]|uniref:Uncharacterized protein n=1 Tax=Pandoraea fibrosis TaxID=1891094 RepID=A0A5E4YDF0_9BURK|nr:hypothetical protein PFI31113_04423 [Pandoraea fibrosis]
MHSKRSEGTKGTKGATGYLPSPDDSTHAALHAPPWVCGAASVLLWQCIVTRDGMHCDLPMNKE